MAVHIRLTRGGTKKKPFYRVVVTDHRAPRDGNFLENIGTFDPTARETKSSGDAGNGEVLKINHERLAFWVARGATPSTTLAHALKRAAKLNPAPVAEAEAAPAAKAAKPKAAKAAKK